MALRQLAAYQKEMSLVESVLAEHPHLFWIAPNPLDADGDAKLWEFRLRSTGFFLRLLRDQKLKLLEFSLFAFFFNEVRCNPYMTDMLFVSSCFDKTSRQSHLRHMAEAIHFLHLLCLPAWMSSTDSRLPQRFYHIEMLLALETFASFHGEESLEKLIEGSGQYGPVPAVREWRLLDQSERVCKQLAACQLGMMPFVELLTRHQKLVDLFPDPYDVRVNTQLWILRLRSAAFLIRLLHDNQIKFLQLVLYIFYWPEISSSPQLKACVFALSHENAAAAAMILLHRLSLGFWSKQSQHSLEMRSHSLSITMHLEQALRLKRCGQRVAEDCLGGATNNSQATNFEECDFCASPSHGEGSMVAKQEQIEEERRVKTEHGEKDKPGEAIVGDNEDVEELRPAAVKRRRLMKGAQDTATKFQTLFSDYEACSSSMLTADLFDVPENQTTIVSRCQQLHDYVSQKFPTWSDRLVRLAAAALACYSTRIGGRMFIGDNIFLLWLLEGNAFLRVHNGFCFIYNGDGAFQPYSGIPPEAVLHRVSGLFVELEGIFRRMPSRTRRDHESVLAAIATDLAKYTTEELFFSACRETAVLQGQPDDFEEGDLFDDEGAGRSKSKDKCSWTLKLAASVWRACQSLRGDMMHDKIIALLVEWCETPSPATAAVAYQDTCVKYDTSRSLPVQHVQKSPANNCYIYIPHPLLDPVLDCHRERLQKFYQETFWANNEVFRCNQAALALAKRGLNIDRCFIGESPGGVGQSLYSTHLDAMLGHNHGFFDPNVWYNEDELRKQVESYARCIVITGQEAPESSKKLHLDLFKKTMSGDGVAGRKPYGYSTRMFSMVGWKRLEVNRMMSFVGIDESNFQSVFRRALVWKPKGRFHPQSVLDNLHADHEKDGHFPADQTLKKFLVTKQASAAGLRIQHAFESKYGEQECVQIIENYVAGGDNYLTEDKMRKACGLSLRIRHEETQDGGVGLLEVMDSQRERDQETEEYSTLRMKICQHLLENMQADLSFRELSKKYKTMVAGAQVPNVPQKTLWSELSSRSLMIDAHRKAARSVHFLQPLLDMEERLDKVIAVDRCSCDHSFPEVSDLKQLHSYLSRDTSRSANVATMKLFLERLCTSKPTRSSTAGRRGPVARKECNEQDLVEEYQKRLEKLEAYEGACLHYSALGEDIAETSSTPRRRAVHKMQAAPQDVVKVSVSYHYGDDRTIRTRRFAEGMGAQKCARRVQMHLFHHSRDLDIANCCVTIMLQLLDKLKPSPEMPAQVKAVLVEWHQSRQKVCEKLLQVAYAEGKALVNRVLNGGSVPPKLQNNEWLKRMQQAGIYLRWFACSVVKDDYKEILQSGQKAFPAATAFYYLWTSVEDYILEHWCEFLKRLQPSHLSLHFDGVRVSSDVSEDVAKIIQESEEHIRKSTGFDVKVVEKRHTHVLEAIKQKAKSSATGEPDEFPDALKKHGNCIPSSLWHLVASKKDLVRKIEAEHPQNTYCLERGHRSYRQCCELFGIELGATLGISSPPPHSFLLHTENGGTPHCVAVKLDKGNATVHDHDARWTISIDNLLAALFEGVDSHTVVTFTIQNDHCAPSDLLLDLQAGSSSSEDELPDADSLIVNDEGEVFAHDNLKDSMEEEVASFLQEVIDDNIRKIGGLYRCTLCPFRSFARLQQLRVHIENYHTSEVQFACSGTKQLKVILALHDDDCIRRARGCDFLFRSASLMARNCAPPLSHRQTYIDREVRLLFTAGGPVYVNKAAFGTTIFARRVLNIYYDKSFAEVLYREVVLHHSNAPWPETGLGLGFLECFSFCLCVFKACSLQRQPIRLDSKLSAGQKRLASATTSITGSWQSTRPPLPSPQQGLVACGRGHFRVQAHSHHPQLSHHNVAAQFRVPLLVCGCHAQNMRWGCRPSKLAQLRKGTKSGCLWRRCGLPAGSDSTWSDWCSGCHGANQRRGGNG